MQSSVKREPLELDSTALLVRVVQLLESIDRKLDRTPAAVCSSRTGAR